MNSQCWDPLRRRYFSSSFFSFNDANALCLQKKDFCSSEVLPNYRGAETHGWRKKANICPVCGKKSENLLLKGRFLLFSSNNVQILGLDTTTGKKRASANQSFFFFKLSRVSNCWKKANICISQLTEDGEKNWFLLIGVISELSLEACLEEEITNG